MNCSSLRRWFAATAFVCVFLLAHIALVVRLALMLPARIWRAVVEAPLFRALDRFSQP